MHGCEQGEVSSLMFHIHREADPAESHRAKFVAFPVLGQHSNID